MTSDQVPEEALYIALYAKKVLKLPCFGSVFRNRYTRNSSEVLIIYLSLDEESVLKQLLGLKGHHIQADATIEDFLRN